MSKADQSDRQQFSLAVSERSGLELLASVMLLPLLLHQHDDDDDGDDLKTFLNRKKQNIRTCFLSHLIQKHNIQKGL